MNNKNNNNSQKIIKISNLNEVPQNYTGIAEILNEFKYWFLNGELHRIDGPAVEWANGDKRWYLNGERHRTDGPAVEWANGNKFWYLNGKRHRIDGPAIEWSNGLKEWYLNDIEANPLFFEIPNYEKYVDYYITILQTELREHEEFLLEELKKRVESKIKLNEMEPTKNE